MRLHKRVDRFLQEYCYHASVKRRNKMNSRHSLTHLLYLYRHSQPHSKYTIANTLSQAYTSLAISSHSSLHKSRLNAASHSTLFFPMSILRLNASTTLCSNIAIVIGPTPPGTGVTILATLHASGKLTSPTSLKPSEFASP